MQLGLPLTLAAAVAAAAALCVFALLHLPFPPAGALAILPMLLKSTLIPTYPLQVAAGTVFFLLTAYLVRTLLLRQSAPATVPQP